MTQTAELWYVLGEKQWASQGHSTRAVSRLLQIGFERLSLECVFAWAADGNRPSLRVLEKNGFRHIGNLRHGHRLGGIPIDRQLFDLLASEYRSVESRDPACTQAAPPNPLSGKF